jgi:hypothetical protein
VGAGVLLGSQVGVRVGAAGGTVRLAVLSGGKTATRLGVEAGWSTAGCAQPANASSPNSSSPAAIDLLMLKIALV